MSSCCGLHQHFIFLPESPPRYQGEVPAGGVAGHLRGQLGGIHALLVLLRALPWPHLPDDNCEWWPVPTVATLALVRGAGVNGAAGAPISSPSNPVWCFTAGLAAPGQHTAHELSQGALLAVLPQHCPWSNTELRAGKVTLSCQGNGETI